MYSDLSDYYLRWYHDRPVGITSRRRDELRKLHAVLYKCAEHLSLHYEDYLPRWMPLGERAQALLDRQKAYPFRAGTWRPDYLLTERGELKICEITSRFFAHGIFMSWFAARAAALFLQRISAETPPECWNERYGDLMDYMRGLPQGKKRIFVFRSDDRTNEIRLYKRFYEAQGMEVHVLDYREVDARRKEWSHGALLLSALNQRDLMGMEDETIHVMLEEGMISDFRNIFLIHDKRFMRLWFEDAFTNACLTGEETAFLRAHAIPTYLCAEGGPVVADALAHKDAYILKPWDLGKSEGLFAGPLTDEPVWRSLWKPRRGEDGPVAGNGRAVVAGMRPVDTMVLQPFLRQRSFPTVWEGQAFDDYLCGMMLCVDDQYFDSGMFRTSSCPVSNLGDDRKAAPLHTDDPVLLSHCDCL